MQEHPMTADTAEREDFEKWWKSPIDGQPFGDPRERAWAAWQARAALPARAPEGHDESAQMQRDIGTLLVMIGYLVEVTEEVLDAEDVALVEQISKDHERRAAMLSASPPPPEQGGEPSLQKAQGSVEALASPAPGPAEPSYWGWWAGADEEYCTIGPCGSREEVIAAAQQEAMGEFRDDDDIWKLRFWICEAEKRPLRLADWIEADRLLERAEEVLSDSDRVGCEDDEGPWFETTNEQDADLRKRIAAACDEWQAAHGLVFTCKTFSASRNHEHVMCKHPLPSGEA
jgi:hypothetical protein